MGPGMMDGDRGGMGPGMMGGDRSGMGPGYFSQNPECQEFYNNTAKLRKELNEKRFDYFETQRNPKEDGDKAAELEKEINELREEISAKAFPGCRW